MRTLTFLLLAGTAIFSVPRADAAYNFGAASALAALTGCTAGQPGTLAPQVDTTRTNMTKAGRC